MIHVQELQKYYTVGANTIKALNGVSLDIDDGEYVTVV